MITDCFDPVCIVLNCNKTWFSEWPDRCNGYDRIIGYTSRAFLLLKLKIVCFDTWRCFQHDLALPSDRRGLDAPEGVDQRFCFHNGIKHFFGYFDLEYIFIDNEIECFSGWPNRYFGQNGTTGVDRSKLAHTITQMDTPDQGLFKREEVVVCCVHDPVFAWRVVIVCEKGTRFQPGILYSWLSKRSRHSLVLCCVLILTLLGQRLQHL